MQLLWRTDQTKGNQMDWIKAVGRWFESGQCVGPFKEQVCSKDIELLAISIRPYYLPREFTWLIVFAVCIPPSANADAACDVLHSVASSLQTQHPQALFLISGDFSHASLSSILPTFTQYVTCHTWDNKTLDVFYGNRKEAYNSSPQPSLGTSDQNLVHLPPVYKPLVNRQPVETRTVKTCFDSTMWEELCVSHREDIDSLTGCITDHINFCVDNTVPTGLYSVFLTANLD